MAGPRKYVPALLIAACALAATPAAAEDPTALLARIRATTPDHDAPVSVRNVDLEMGTGIFSIQRGILFPVRIDGRAIELVFIGQARFLVEAPDEIEAGQLELFTGERSVEAPVEEAVLVLSNERAIQDLLRRAPPHELRPELIERADEVHRRWMASPERRSAGVESAIFKCLIGDAAFQEYFALWARSFELGEFVFQLDPEDQEQITLARFNPLEISNWERMRLKHHIRVQQRKGRWLDVRVEDLGAWDVWLSTPWTPTEGPPLPGNVGFETEHYEIDATLKRHGLKLEGLARLHLRAESSGRRALRLELMRDLRVDGVVDESGRDLFFFRSGEETVVLLPELSVAGNRFVLEVSYSGRALNWVQGKSHDLQDTSNWHPHCGTVDRATYDVTLRWPKSYDVIAGGRVVDAGKEGRYLWERRRLDVPSIAFSFAVGRFVVDRVKVGHVDLTVALSRSRNMTVSPELRAQTVDAVSRALTYFEEAFGPYPLDELTVVTVPRQFSQSFLGFVTLADSLIRQPDPLAEEAIWTRETTIAHELAHQWWGNLVGWWSYRDQWLSEGMANYAALLFGSHASADEADRLAIMSAGWRDSLSRTTLEGRTIESLGPIVLGNRLNSSRAHNGYRTIVYRKGAVVLAMLARAVGEARFVQMLHSLADAASGQVLTTESFLKALERMSGMDLEGFAGQYVYGTGIPEVYYAYELDQDEEGGWKVQGEARLLSAPRYRHEIHRTEAGWEVRRFIGPKPEEGPTTLMVPYVVTLEESNPPMQSGQLVLNGHRDGFAIETAVKPVDLRLDPRGEILAWFYSEDLYPKRVLRYHAEDLAAEGKLEEAEAGYVEALASPITLDRAVDPLAPGVTEPRVGGRVENLRIRLALVRLYMERGDRVRTLAALDEIEAELEQDEPMLFRMERDVLRARLELQEQNHGAAFRRLKKTLRLASPRRERVPWRDLIWQLQLNTERAAVTEAYALLAVTAHETDNPDEFQWAVREARDRGVDVSALAAARRDAEAARR